MQISVTENQSRHCRPFEASRLLFRDANQAETEFQETYFIILIYDYDFESFLVQFVPVFEDVIARFNLNEKIKKLTL